MQVTAEYDREADALYVRLDDGDRQRAIEIDDSTYVDVDAHGRALGLEFLYPSMGLNLQEATVRFSLEAQLPQIVAAIASTTAPVSLPTMTGGQHLASTAIVRVSVEGTVGAARGTPLESVGHADRLIRSGVPA